MKERVDCTFKCTFPNIFIRVYMYIYSRSCNFNRVLRHKNIMREVRDGIILEVGSLPSKCIDKKEMAEKMFDLTVCRFLDVRSLSRSVGRTVWVRNGTSWMRLVADWEKCTTHSEKERKNTEGWVGQQAEIEAYAQKTSSMKGTYREHTQSEVSRGRRVER